MENKKGIIFGVTNIVWLFALMFFFLLIIGGYILVYEEAYKPSSEFLKERVLEQNGDNESDIYLLMVENEQNLENINIGFNIIFIILVIISISYGLINAYRSPRINLFTLFFNISFGLITTIFILHYVVIEFLEYLRIEIINYIFGDLVLQYLPFYGFIYEYWGLVALLYFCAMIIINYFFGKRRI